MVSVFFFIELYPVTLASGLSCCRSRMVPSCCCEHGQVYNLACVDIFYNKRLALAKPLDVLLGPLTFIICSYITVMLAVLRIASATQRWKAFNTCLTHMILVFIYYLPVILAYKLAMSWHIYPNFHMPDSSLFPIRILPPSAKPSLPTQVIELLPTE